MNASSWIAGLLVSVVIGGPVTWLFLKLLRQHMRLEKEDEDPDTLAVPPWLLGMLERLFFTIVIAFQVPGAAVAMMVWLTVKMAANWNRPQIPNDKIVSTRRSRRAMSALLAGLVAMGFALIGGLIVGGDIANPILFFS